MENDPPLPDRPEPSLPVELPAAEFLPAGFWVRGGAFLIDGLILALSAFLPVAAAGAFVGLAYKTIFTSQGGQTPGKMAAGIKVVSVSGEPVGIGRALGRAAAEYLSAMLLGLGYVAAAFSDKRALHDYIAGTRVVYLEGVGAGRKAAFAFLGVMAFIVPVALIAGMAHLGLGSFGKFKELALKSSDGAAKGSLGMLRSAASIYYGDAEGLYPATLDALVPNYINAVPKAKVGGHMETSAWTPYGAEVCGGEAKFGTEIDTTKIKDTGGWGFVTDPSAKCYGQIFVDCTHPDTMGAPWPNY